MLAKITALFAKDNVNVENMSNRTLGDYAYAIVDLGARIDESVVEDVKCLPNIIRVRVIE